MIFKTKFNLNDHVWYMTQNKPTEVVILAIEIFYVGTNQDTITYRAKDVLNPVAWLGHTKLHESVLFNSKSELLEAL